MYELAARLVFLVACSVQAYAQSSESAPFRPEATSGPSGSLAVFDFVSVGAAENDWSAGLADLMSAALRDSGVMLIERQQLRYVLSERDLRRALTEAQREVLAHRLPAAAYLLNGEIEGRPDSSFELRISVVRTSDGSERAALHARGHYPADLTTAIANLAAQLAGLISAPTSQPRKTITRHFTRNPEIALLFYKGVQNYVSGRFEVAEEYFRLAARRDPAFKIAAAWQIKSYEALGLDDFAALVREKSLQGSGSTQLLARAVSAESAHGPVVCLSRRSTGGLEAEQQLRRLLQQRAGIHVFEPEWLQELTREMDLSILPDFDPHVLLWRTWLPVDYIVYLHPVSDSTATSVEIIDCASGISVARRQWPSDEQAQHVIAEDVVKILKGGAGASTQPGHRPPAAPPELSEPRDRRSRTPEYDLQDYAWYLRMFADAPEDPLKLLAFYRVLRGSLWSEDDWATRSWPFLELMMNRLQALAPSQPDAANWLSHALWTLWYKGDHSPDELPSPAREIFAPLLAGYPESFAAFCARGAIAMEAMADGRHEEAAALLHTLVAEGQTTWREQTRWRQATLLAYLAARANRFIGQDSDATKYMRAAYERLVQSDAGWLVRSPEDVQRRAELLGLYLYGVMRSDTASSLPEWETQEFGVRRDIRDRLSGKGPGLEILEAHAAASRAPTPPPTTAPARSSGATARARRRQRLHESIQQLRSQEWPDRELGPRLRSLTREATELEDDQTWSALNECLQTIVARPGMLPHDVLTFLWDEKRLPELLNYAERQLASEDRAERAQAVRIKEQVLTRQGRHLENAAFLSTRLAAFETSSDAFSLYDYLDLLYQLAAAHRRSGNTSDVIRVYLHGIDELSRRSLHPADAQKEITSLTFHVAELKVKRGETPEAIDLLKEVARAAEDKDWPLTTEGSTDYLDANCHRVHGEGTPKLYSRAVNRLESLRTAATRPAEERFVDRIIAVSVHREREDKLVLDVEYEYSGDRGPSAFIGGEVAHDGERLESSYQPGEIREGRGSTRLAVYARGFRKPFTTNQIRLRFHNSSGVFLEQFVAHSKTWRPPGPSPAPASRPTCIVDATSSVADGALSNEIHGLCVVEETANRLVVDIDCFYDGRAGERASVSLYAADDGLRMSGLAHKPGDLVKGRHIVRAELTTDGKRQLFRSNQLQIVMQVAGHVKGPRDPIAERFIDFDKVWTPPVRK